MKTLVINGSPRKSGNTVTFLKELQKYLIGEYFQIDTYYTKSSPCNDCRYCWTNAECIIKDEMQDVFKKIDEVDNIIIASPIYFGNITGSLLNWASRLQYFWVSRRIRKEEPLSIKYRKGAVVLIVNHGKDNIDSAIFSGKDLLKKVHAECCDILQWSDADGANQSSPSSMNIDKIVKLAHKLNTHQ
jgi:multimeric flavodoxin WrbA